MKIMKWLQRSKWKEIDSHSYQRMHKLYGGSVITHPQFIAAVSELTAIPLRYEAYYDAGKIVCAAPIWNNSIAGGELELRSALQYDRTDFGNMEIILPTNPNVQAIPLPFYGRYISAVHRSHFSSLREESHGLCLAKGFLENEFTKKFIYNRKRELRLLADEGMIVRDCTELSSDDIANIYIDLFTRRWSRKPMAFAYINKQLNGLREFIAGKVLFLNERPIAIQLLFRAQSPAWVSYEFLNGGVDPEFRNYSPGSVLSFLNTQAALKDAQLSCKQLRYSFGLADADYKLLWCRKFSAYRT